MQTFIPGPLSDHARNILRRIGYAEQRTRSGQISYTKRVSSERFPRYHAYVEDKDGGIQVNLHVDQKEASYEGSSAHSGDYEGPVVEREMATIVAFVQGLKSAPAAQHQALNPKPQKKQTGFLSKFF